MFKSYENELHAIVAAMVAEITIIRVTFVRNLMP